MKHISQYISEQLVSEAEKDNALMITKCKEAVAFQTDLKGGDEKEIKKFDQAFPNLVNFFLKYYTVLDRKEKGVYKDMLKVLDKMKTFGFSDAKARLKELDKLVVAVEAVDYAS